MSVRDSIARFATKARAHSVLNDGTIVMGRVLVDNADGVGMLFCEDGMSASEGAPNSTDGRWRRLLLAPAPADIVCLDMKD
jgi:hypothetical protein